MCSGVYIEVTSCQVVHTTVGAKFRLIDARVSKLRDEYLFLSLAVCSRGEWYWSRGLEVRERLHTRRIAILPFPDEGILLLPMTVRQVIKRPSYVSNSLMSFSR